MPNIQLLQIIILIWVLGFVIYIFFYYFGIFSYINLNKYISIYIYIKNIKSENIKITESDFDEEERFLEFNAYNKGLLPHEDATQIKNIFFICERRNL